MIKHLSGCLSFVPFEILPAVVCENICGEDTFQQGQANTCFRSSLFVSCLISQGPKLVCQCSLGALFWSGKTDRDTRARAPNA